jgi:hypothetical protein
MAEGWGERELVRERSVPARPQRRVAVAAGDEYRAGEVICEDGVRDDSTRGMGSMNIWESIPLINTGFTLAAFLAAVAAWVYRLKILEKEKLLRTAPEAKRAELVAAAMEFFHVDTARLTKQQQFEIALQQIRARAQRSLLTTILIGIIAIVLAVTVYATTKNSVVTRPTTFFKILDGDTGDAVRCPLTIEYVADGVPGKDIQLDAEEQGQFDLSGKVTVTNVTGFPGYDFRREDKPETRDGRQVIKLWRNENFAKAISPGKPDVSVPTSSYEEAQKVPGKPDPNDVKFTCKNDTKYTVELFYYRYFTPDQLPMFLADAPIGPETCKPGVTPAWDSFGDAPGGAFYFFASVGGSKAKLITNGRGETKPAYILNALNPQLVLSDDDGWLRGEVRLVLGSTGPPTP